MWGYILSEWVGCVYIFYWLVGVGGDIFWVGGGGWTFFMGEWGWVGV